MLGMKKGKILSADAVVRIQDDCREGGWFKQDIDRSMIRTIVVQAEGILEACIYLKGATEFCIVNFVCLITLFNPRIKFSLFVRDLSQPAWGPKDASSPPELLPTGISAR